jgi:hypothetical protein
VSYRQVVSENAEQTDDLSEESNKPPVELLLSSIHKQAHQLTFTTHIKLLTVYSASASRALIASSTTLPVSARRSASMFDNTHKSEQALLCDQLEQYVGYWEVDTGRYTRRGQTMARV